MFIQNLKHLDEIFLDGNSGSSYLREKRNISPGEYIMEDPVFRCSEKENENLRNVIYQRLNGCMIKGGGDAAYNVRRRRPGRALKSQNAGIFTDWL